MTILKNPLDSLDGGLYYGARSGRCLDLVCSGSIVSSLTLGGRHYRICGRCSRAWDDTGAGQLVRDLLRG